MKRILLVEDEFLEREALKMILSPKPQQYKIIGEVDNGIDAIDFIQNNKVDIIFMDIKMPKLGGIEASRRIKEINPAIAIIIITAYNDFELAQSAIKYNIDDYLLKPTRPKLIYEALENIVSKISYKNILKQDSNPTDIKEKLKRNFLQGDYIKAKENLKELHHTKFQSAEEAHTILKDILITLSSIANGFGIDVDKQLQEEVKSRLKNIMSQEQYLQILDLIFEEIFQVIIEEKRVKYPKEMDYALQYIEKKLTHNLTLEKVATYMNISPHYFSKLFKAQVGINFVDYITQRKINQAKEMITTTDHSLCSIAYALGFNEANYFSKVFKKTTGLTPSKYREQFKETQNETNKYLQRATPQIYGKWIV